MSDLLSRLRRPPEPILVGRDYWYNEALDDVRKALRNPTDEQVEQGAKELVARMQLWPKSMVNDLWFGLTPAERSDWLTITREAWAAAAGDDQ